MEKGLIRRLLPLLILAAGTLPAAAQTAPLPRGADKAPDAIRRWLGAWELALADASRSCTVTLSAEAAGNRRQLRFPATCRRALPILGTAASWSLNGSGQPQFMDATGKEVIAFQSGTPEAGLDGKGSDGKAYKLSSGAHPRVTSQGVQSAAQRITPVDPATAPAASSLPGRYVVMRQQNREACRLVLSPAGADGRQIAAFEGMCPDTGLTIFDPVAWRYVGGRLTLVARRGHGTDLVFENGQWRKDPAVGAPLMMRKLTP